MSPIGKLTQPSNEKRSRLFKNSFLESITRTHAFVPVAFYLILSIISFGYGCQRIETWIPSGIFIAMGGCVSFTLVEYIMHRFLYHMVADIPIKEKVRYNLHGVHHDYPLDKGRLAMPIFLSILYASIFYLLFIWIMGNAGYFFYGGFLTGYAGYLLIHHIVHTRLPPKNCIKILWIHHAIHHYRNSDVAFGVTSPLWDFVFGTLPKRDNIPDKV